ncbi:MAG: undecaprenol kinase [Candidatus Parcubacteria bacterium]
MEIFHSITLGIVEGLTEFLPVSSTAHIDIVRSLLAIPATDFVKSFEIIIQLGAIMAVVVLYFKKIFSWKVIKSLFIAFVPTGILGFILYKIIKVYLLGNTFVIAMALILGGAIIILFERNYNHAVEEDRDIEDLSTIELLSLGTAQALAVIPGVSRSGAVIIFGRLIKIPRKLITEFSFMLAVPTMLAATLYDIYNSGLSMTSSQWGSIGIGFIVSFIVAYFVIKIFLDYIRKNSFEVFGWYRIILGFVIILVLFNS